MPFLPLDYPDVRAAIGRALPPGTFLITGALRAEPAPPGSPRPRRIFNSILVFGEEGSLAGRYDKTHLVPFGEYLPLQSLLEAIGLQQLTRLRGGFDVGVTPRPLLYVPRLPPAAPLICYEAIFPGTVVQSAERPALLLNVTNDGWFGDTTGPRQHLQQARVRAVEEGLPLVRAANNGISAAIDGYGRILARIELNARGTIDVALPVALSPPPYARLGDTIFFALWLVGAAWWRLAISGAKVQSLRIETLCPTRAVETRIPAYLRIRRNGHNSLSSIGYRAQPPEVDGSSRLHLPIVGREQRVRGCHVENTRFRRRGRRRR